ncbi:MULTISPECIES: helix-turn-helix domain-containing protein [Listeria]|uniref:helix-turn-helix domain-containing protein n=1 Tax=Listeria TaxID=1637 RepID=UPI000E6C6801|nr:MULTISPECIES: helix-turn-helix domain-containing protein [Listeria]MBF2612556.1 helix-turn-helix domain-containing protein [Listeria welshimeri]RJA51380.1 DNA-binding protein [Listeria monocytogenes]
MYFLDDDDVIKQKIVAELNKYVLTQRQVAEFLGVSPNNMSTMIKDRKIEPFFVFEDGSVRKINLFYKKDIEDYAEKLKALRNLRKNS